MDRNCIGCIDVIHWFFIDRLFNLSWLEFIKQYDFRLKINEAYKS